MLEWRCVVVVNVRRGALQEVGGMACGVEDNAVRLLHAVKEAIGE